MIFIRRLVPQFQGLVLVLIDAVPFGIHHAQHVQGISALAAGPGQAIFKPFPGCGRITRYSGTVKKKGSDDRLPGITGSGLRHGLAPGPDIQRMNPAVLQAFRIQGGKFVQGLHVFFIVSPGAFGLCGSRLKTVFPDSGLSRVCGRFSLFFPVLFRTHRFLFSSGRLIFAAAPENSQEGQQTGENLLHHAFTIRQPPTAAKQRNDRNAVLAS